MNGAGNGETKLYRLSFLCRVNSSPIAFSSINTFAFPALSGRFPIKSKAGHIHERSDQKVSRNGSSGVEVLPG